MALKDTLVQYDFTKPIVITEYRPRGMDILFYSFMLGLSLAVLIFLLFFHDGHFGLDLRLWKVIVSIPVLLVALLFNSLLKEQKKYTAKLATKSTWTIEELMILTGKNRQETEQIITRVLESSFKVKMDCIRNAESIKY